MRISRHERPIARIPSRRRSSPTRGPTNSTRSTLTVPTALLSADCSRSTTPPTSARSPRCRAIRPPQSMRARSSALTGHCVSPSSARRRRAKLIRNSAPSSRRQRTRTVASRMPQAPAIVRIDAFLGASPRREAQQHLGAAREVDAEAHAEHRDRERGDQHHGAGDRGRDAAPAQEVEMWCPG